MTTPYPALRIALTDGQRGNLRKAFAAKTAVTLRVKPGQIGGGDELLLTATQISRLKKASAERRGADLRLTKTQIMKTAQRGGNLFSTALSLARPFLVPAAKAAGKALATAGLNFGAEKLLKKVFGSNIGPREIQLYWLVQSLTPLQKKEIERAKMFGKGMHPSFSPSKKSGKGHANKPPSTVLRAVGDYGKH